MPRTARVVVTGCPHHVTQRGNFRQVVFACDADRMKYLDLLTDATCETELEILAWCMMPNHVHLVAVPRSPDSFARALKRVHGRHSLYINQRSGHTGHLWQGRFFSCPLGDSHLLAAVRYVELNPVRAGLVACAWDYTWSSARDHVLGAYRAPLSHSPLLDSEIRDWRAFLDTPADDMEQAIRRATTAGTPAGDSQFCDRLEREFGRPLRIRSQGRPRKAI